MSVAAFASAAFAAFAAFTDATTVATTVVKPYPTSTPASSVGPIASCTAPSAGRLPVHERVRQPSRVRLRRRVRRRQRRFRLRRLPAGDGLR